MKFTALPITDLADVTLDLEQLGVHGIFNDTALGGALSGKLPNPSLAAGAAASNLGPASGDLTGTYPGPTFSAAGLAKMLRPANNLSDIASAPSSRQNLGMRTSRTSSGSIAALGRALITCAWAVAFPDTSYTAVATMTFARGAAVGALRVERIESKATGNVVVAVINDDGGTAWTGVIECIGIHD